LLLTIKEDLGNIPKFTEKEMCCKLFKEMARSEIENTKASLHLWNMSQIDFLVVSDGGDSAYIHVKILVNFCSEKLNHCKSK
jgi:hypothetical protein